MRLKNYKTDLKKRLRDPEYAAEYLAQALAKKDNAAFLIALKDMTLDEGAWKIVLDKAREGGLASGMSYKPAGMKEFEYLASDGGPHLFLPKELSGKWSSKNDYARACAATKNQLMALLPVGDGQTIVLGDPPLSAWGHSPEGWVDIYNLEAWTDTNLDALIKRAVANTPTSGMKDTGKAIRLNQPGVILLFAGDSPGNSMYGENYIQIDAGTYRILEGHYNSITNEEIYIYRLQPSPDKQ